MTAIAYYKTAIIGDTGDSLDGEDGAILNNKDFAFVMSSGEVSFYKLDATSGLTHNPPTIVSPSVNAGTKRWILQDVDVSTIDADDIDDSSTTNKFVTSSDLAKLLSLSGINTGDQDLSGYAIKSNVLELDNTAVFTPTLSYHPATKKYVDEFIVENVDTFATKVNVLELDNTTAFAPTLDYHPTTKIFVEDLISASPGGDLIVQSEGTVVDSAATILNFIGTNVTVVESADHTIDITVATVDIPISSVNGATGVVTLDPDDLDDSSSTNKFTTQVDKDSIDAAIVKVEDMEEDQILSTTEKTTWRSNWLVMDNDYTIITDRADGFSIPTTAFDAARLTLYNYLVAAGVWSDPSNPYTITGTDLTSRVTSFYEEMQLLNDLNSDAKTEGWAFPGATANIWQGEFAVPPASPQDGWSYYNTTDKKSYGYQDGSWYQIAEDGLEGDPAVNYIQSSIPTGADVDEIWVNTDTGNLRRCAVAGSVSLDDWPIISDITDYEDVRVANSVLETVIVELPSTEASNFLINKNNLDVDSTLTLGRTTGGTASVVWNGSYVYCSKPFKPVQLGINNISVTEPTETFAGQLWVTP